MKPEIAYLPDFGRPVGVYQPHDLSFMFPDPDEDLLVVLIITRSKNSAHLEIIIGSSYGRSLPFQRPIYTVTSILCRKRASTTSPIGVQSPGQKEGRNISSQWPN